MDASDTQKYYKRYSMPKGALYGAVGGLVAGWVMAPFLMITVIMVGASQDTFFIAIGEYFVADQDDAVALQTGLTMHLMTGVIIGTIFGVVTASVGKLRITSFARGVGEGLATGIIAFVVLFLPLTMAVFPNLIEAMAQNNPDLTEEQMANWEAGAFPSMIGLAVLDHLVYGAVLGVVTAGFVVGVRKVSKKSVEK